MNYSILFHALSDTEAKHGVVVRIHKTVRDVSCEKYDEFIYMQVRLQDLVMCGGLMQCCFHATHLKIILENDILHPHMLHFQ